MIAWSSAVVELDRIELDPATIRANLERLLGVPARPGGGRRPRACAGAPSGAAVTTARAAGGGRGGRHARLQRHALRARPARRRPAGGARQDHRGGARRRGGGSHPPQRPLLGAPCRPRRAARPARHIRPGVRAVLARDPPAECGAGAGLGERQAASAGGAAREPPGRRGHRAPPPRTRRSKQEDVESRARRGAHLFAPGSAAGDGLRGHVGGRAGRGEAGDRGAAACPSSRWRRGASGPMRWGGGSTCGPRFARACVPAAT